MQAAAERFGNSAELSHELESALPASERRGYIFERIFGWRAPESACCVYMLRQATLSFAIMFTMCLLIAIGILSLAPAGQNGWQLVRTALAVVLITPLCSSCWAFCITSCEMHSTAQFGRRNRK